MEPPHNTLRRAGIAFAGDNWRWPVALALRHFVPPHSPIDVDVRLIEKWERAEEPIPSWVWFSFELLFREHGPRFSQIADLLQRQLQADGVTAQDLQNGVPNLSRWSDDFAEYVRRQVKEVESQAIADPWNQQIRDNLEYVWFHNRRWVMTFEKMAPFISLDAKILELGGRSQVLNFLSSRGVETAATSSDLRDELSDIGTNAFDVVLCLEVIEHIKDREGSQPVDVFNNSGVRSLVSEIFRVLKPGGIVVCTTPNACSYANIARIALMEPPMFFRQHVKEFAPSELKSEFEEAGFETALIETPPDPWGQKPDLDIQAAIEFVRRAGVNDSLREEDIVAIFVRGGGS